MDGKILSTKQAAAELGVGVERLGKAVWADRVAAPMRGPGRVFLWQEVDIERASWVLNRRAIEDVRAERRQREGVAL